MTNTVDEVRDTGPYTILCKRCRRRFGFAAPHPFLDTSLLDTALVPKSQRTGGFSDLAGYRNPGEPPVGVTLGYEPDSVEWEHQSRRGIILSGEGRYTFRCKCGNSPVLKDPTLVRVYLGVHNSNSAVILL